MGLETCFDPLDRFHTIHSTLDEKPPDGYMWSGGRFTRKQLTSRPDQSKARVSGNQWESTPSWRKSRSGLRKHENCVGSISSTPRIRNSKKPSRTRVSSWKHQWLLLCPVKLRKLWEWCIQQIKTKLACILEADRIHKNAYGKFDTALLWTLYWQEKGEKFMILL